MLLDKNCIHYAGSRKNCSVTQNGKTYRVQSDPACEIAIYIVDSCLINENHLKKCDYLFLIKGAKGGNAYFVELKGTGLTDAINQIHSSIDMLCQYLREHKIFGRIVGKRVTPNIKSRRAKLDEKLKKMGGNLVIVSGSEYIENI